MSENVDHPTRRRSKTWPSKGYDCPERVVATRCTPDSVRWTTGGGVCHWAREPAPGLQHPLPSIPAFAESHRVSRTNTRPPLARWRCWPSHKILGRKFRNDANFHPPFRHGTSTFLSLACRKQRFMTDLSRPPFFAMTLRERFPSCNETPGVLSPYIVDEYSWNDRVAEVF